MFLIVKQILQEADIKNKLSQKLVRVSVKYLLSDPCAELRINVFP